MPQKREDLDRTVDLLQYQVDLMSHVLSNLCSYLDMDFEELLADADRELNRPQLKLVKK